jgi:hypothetical protein
MAGHHSLVHGGKFMCGAGSFGGKNRGNMFLAIFFHLGLLMGGCAVLWGNYVGPWR